MILEAERLGVVREVLVIAAALSLQDPRERPVEKRPQADQLHARFTDKSSDFLTWLNLWRYLREQQRELLEQRLPTDVQARVPQLPAGARVAGLRVPAAPGQQGDEDQARQARRGRWTPTASTRRCWPGCSATSGCSRSADRKERGPREYLGARNSRFAIFPGSALKGANPAFLMAGELVETGRLWARQNAAIQPEWAERIGAHLVKRTYSEPHWSKKRAAVMAHERVTLYGVPLVADRVVPYAKIDPALSREMFIRHALVYGEWSTHQPFYRENLRLLEEAEELEHRARRRDLVVDEHTLFDFYDARVGADAVSGAHFDQWWKQTRRTQPDLLTFDPEMLTHDAADEVARRRLPDVLGRRGPDLPDQLSLRARRRRRRADHRRPRRHPQPGRGRGLLLERARACARSWSPRCCAACPSTCGSASCRRPTPRATSSPRCRPVRSRCSTRSSDTCARRPAWSCRATPGTGTRWPTTCGPTYRVVDDGGQEQARSKDLDALKAPLQPAFDRALAEVASDAGLSATRSDAMDVRHGRGVRRPTPGGSRGPRLPRAGRRGHAPSGWGSSARRTRPRRGTGSASAACC